jgi:hypothetical protein
VNTTLSSDDLRRRARQAGESGWITALARIGLVAKGVSYALVGALAIGVAIGEGGKATSRQGALSEIASHGWGKLLLVVLALGFAGYAVWRLAEAIFGRNEDDDGAKGWAKRAGKLARAAICAGLTFTAIKLVAGAGGQESQTAKAHKTTAEALSWPAGRWLVGIGGACLIGAGLYNGYRGVSEKYLEHWRTGEMSSVERTWGTRVSLAGLLARMVVFGLIGVFVIKAAVEYDPKEAVGLDGALRRLAGHAYGTWLLGLVAAGLVAYAVFCLLEARYREV